MLIDDLVSAEVPRVKARDYVEGVISEQANIFLILEFQQSRKQEAWAEAGAAGLQQAQAIVGGPAGPPPQLPN